MRALNVNAGRMAKITYEGLFGVVTVDTRKQNPMIRSVGNGPEGKRCKTCAFLIRKSYSKTYYKCQFRGNTNGPGTDHKVNWPACSRYKEDEPNV